MTMTDEQKKLRLERINKKGWEVNQKLTELLAGKNVTLADLNGTNLDLIDDKEKKLREFLDQINAARHRLQNGPYGKCLGCGKPFSDGQLDEMPWLELCAECEQQGAHFERRPESA